jgi:hypothetical protein
MQAVLALPHCEIYLLRTFPRIVDLEVPANHTVVLFSMVGTSDTIINGQPLDHLSLVLGRGPTDYRMVEAFTLSNISTPGFRQIGEKQSTATNWQVSFGSRFEPCIPRCSRFAA